VSRLQGIASTRHIGTLLRVQREDGQAMVEYALILALVTIASIAALQLMGIDVSRVIGNVNNRLSAVAT
jgi:pilus assembly protein Flp/PilA